MEFLLDSTTETHILASEYVPIKNILAPIYTSDHNIVMV